MPDLAKTDAVFTFEGLIRKTPSSATFANCCALLQAKLGFPADIEFAYDGNDFYLFAMPAPELQRLTPFRSRSRRTSPPNR